MKYDFDFGAHVASRYAHLHEKAETKTDRRSFREQFRLVNERCQTGMKLFHEAR